jgi:hypothetical protein
MNILVLSVLCVTNFLSHCMENKPTKEAIAAANNSLWKAAKNNDLAKIKQLIAEGIADVNSADVDGNTALICAAESYSFDDRKINTLIKASAGINMQNHNGDTALICAAKVKNADNVYALIKAGADINRQNYYGETALICAAKSENNYYVLDILIKAGADINTKNKMGNTALIYATKYNSSMVTRFIEAGANTNVTNKLGYTALIYILESKDCNMEYSFRISYGSFLEDSSPGLILPNSIRMINPSRKSFTKKKIALLLMFYKEGSLYLSVLPKEVLKLIIAYMHPEEFTMDRALICSLHPQALVDNIPLENLALLIKDGALNQDTILATWQKKINGIAESLKAQKKLNDDDRQAFATEALAKITMLLANK